jgi:hypothetical protein
MAKFASATWVTAWQVAYLWKGERHIAGPFPTLAAAKAAADGARAKFGSATVEPTRMLKLVES